MARTQRQRADSFSTSSESSFDSNEQLSDMEEPDNSQVTTDKKQKKIWVMRSGPSKTAPQQYDPVAGDDQYDAQQPSDDAAGQQGMDYGSYSDEEKGKKKGGGASDAYADDKGGDGQDYEDGEAQDGDKNGKKKKSNKMIWVWSGVAAIVLILILLALYWFWLRSKPEEVDEKDSSSSSSSNNSSMASALNNSAISSAIPATIASPVTTLPTKNGTIETSLDLSPLPTSLSNNSIPSATRRPTPTTTSSADDSSATYFAQITWFNADENRTPCGTKPNDGDYVVRVSEELYGDTTSVSPLCGKWISLYQLETDSYTDATIEGVCSHCTGRNIDMSRAVFNALTQDMKLGTTLAQWWWTAKKDQPKNTLKSVVASPAQSTMKPSEQAAQGGSIDASFEPLDTTGDV